LEKYQALPIREENAYNQQDETEKPEQGNYDKKRPPVGV
jgi:hypothetical protein